MIRLNNNFDYEPYQLEKMKELYGYEYTYGSYIDNNYNAILTKPISENRKKDKVYQIWYKMVRQESYTKFPYTDITVCKEWHEFSNFEKWYKDNSGCLISFETEEFIATVNPFTGIIEATNKKNSHKKVVCHINELFEPSIYITDIEYRNLITQALNRLELKPEDKKRMQKLNIKHSYGLSIISLLRLTNQHKRARENKQWYTMKLVEYRLTDINFHDEVALLRRGKYDMIINNYKKG